jgi:cell division transport system permease protein
MRSDSLRTVFYAFISVVTNFRKNAFLHLTSIFTVLICFFVLGCGINIFFNIRSILHLSKLQTHISVYMQKEIDESELTSFRQRRCMEKFISHCKYVSAAQAKEKFSQKNPDLKDTIEALDDNPFPPSIEIDFEKDFKSVEILKQYSRELSEEKLVLYVDDGGKWVTNWLNVLNLFDRLTYLLGLGFALMVAFVISNTIKLLVYSRKDEVEILSLVGATRNIIRLPFLTEGVLHGLLGSVFALVGVKLFFVWVVRYLERVWPGFLPEQIVFIPWLAQILLVVLASLIGWVGSHLAVGKFLK